MQGKGLLASGCLIALLMHAISCQALAVVDDSGRRVELPQPAKRIITLSPSLTELVFDLGAGKRIVATVRFSHYPSAAKTIPRIGGSMQLNLELILKYRPDLVLAWGSGNNPYQLQAIKRLGIPVFRSEPRSLQDIASTLIKLGKLLGLSARAERLASKMQLEIKALRRQYAGRKVITGFYQVWDKPIYTVNGKQIISSVMQLCGVHNIFANAPIIAPHVSLEQVLARNPQIIISSVSAKTRASAFSLWRHWPQLSAVQHHNLFKINADLIQLQTPRVLEGAHELCREADLARQHLRFKKGARRTEERTGGRSVSVPEMSGPKPR